MKQHTALTIILLFSTTLPAAADWPQFRGPNGSAVATGGKSLPARFGPAENVLWKTPLPEGWSSPCISGDHIFVTGYHPATRKLETICLDRRSGRIRWRRAAPATKIERVYKTNSPASATPATDGKRVYVSFGSYGLLCYDFAGKEIWRRPLPTPRVGFGSATSPVVVGDLLLLNGQEPDLNLMALKAATGTTVWVTKESPFPSHHPTPLVWRHGDVAEVVIPGRNGMMSYNLADGSKRWWLPGTSREVSCSPTLGDGLLFFASHAPGGDPDMRLKLPDFSDLMKKYDTDKDGRLSRKEVPKDVPVFSRGGKDGVGVIHLHQMYWLFDKNRDNHVDAKEYRLMLTNPFTNSLLAIRPGGREDISETHIVWREKRGVPEVPSPLFYQGRIYMVRNGGVVSCLDAKTGKHVFRRSRLGAAGIYYASPVAGDGKVYFASDTGVVTVLKAGAGFEVLAENNFGETIRATPALVDGKVYLRTAAHLYVLGD